MIFGPFRALFVLGIVGALVGVFFGVKGAVTAKHAVDSVNRKGGDEQSMFHAKRLDAGLAKVRAEVGADGKLLQLNIYPGYIQVDASTGSEDKARSFRIQEDGKVDELPVTLTGPGRLADNVFALAEVDTAIVEKLAGQAAAKEHSDLDDVSHVVVMIEPDSGTPGINVYLKNSRYWRAALDGSGLSNPDQQARKTIDGVQKTLSGLDAGKAPAPATAAPDTAAPGAEDLATCITAAGTDATKIAACTK
ncbi:MAG TPA: hypothetical protein VNT03_08255 [Baekduia sp.]|nr:hypothetical protein [Baekduia sp.]